MIKNNKINQVKELFLKRKYVITFVAFFLWIAFFDSSNFINQVENISKISDLEKEKLYWKQHIIEDSSKLSQLRTNKENLEKFAREQYKMKKKDEDIYIIEEDEIGE